MGKAAEAAEKDMIAKAKLANAAKATKAQKDAAAAAKKKEEAAAASALAAAKAAYEAAEKEAAFANAASISAASSSKNKNAEMAKALAKYEAVKTLHLQAQAAYAGAKSAAAKHAEAVKYIGHPQHEVKTCRNGQAKPPAKGLWPISKKCTRCNQGSWNYNVATQQACQDKAVAGKAKHYTYKAKLKQCRIDANSQGCKSHGKGYSDCAGNVHTHP